MSETFEFRTESTRWREFLTALVDRRGDLSITAQLDDRRLDTTDIAVIDLPASDARRLRDWLCERYPEETTNGD